MITIDLYQPNAVDEKINFPSEWNDLTLDELHLVAKTILTNFETPYEAQVALFRSLLKIRTGNKVKHIEDRLDAEDTFINGLPAVEFIFKENNLTRQPYSFIRIAGSKYFGPKDDFNDLTCGEFEDAEICYNEFIMEPNQDKLAELAAILYRPMSILTQKRKKYLYLNKVSGIAVEYDAEKMAPKFKKLKPWVLYCIFLWYAGCRNQLPKIFPNCFGAPLAPGEEKRDPDFLIFTKCIHAGAGDKNGTRDQIRTTKLKEFFFDIEMTNIENEKLQNQIDNA